MWNKAAELGSIRAHALIADRYYNGDGVDKDENKALYHWKVAAIKGHEAARNKLGHIEMKNKNPSVAMEHFKIAARAGHDDSLRVVGMAYKAGMVTKDDYASILRAHKDCRDELKSTQREEFSHAIEYR